MVYICLVYASKSTGHMIDSVGDILDASERNNPPAGITGMLCSNSSYFLQCLEGPRTEVSSAFLRIAKDSRHCEVELLQSLESKERLFPGWSMGYVGNTVEATDMIEKYLGVGGFNPYMLTAGQALFMLGELSNTLPSRTRALPPAQI